MEPGCGSIDSTAREHLTRIYREAIAALSPARLIERALSAQDVAYREIPPILAAAQQLSVLAVGKAAPGMAAALARLCRTKLDRLLAIVPIGSGAQLREELNAALADGGPLKQQPDSGTGGTHHPFLQVLEADHPLPSQASAEAGAAALRFVGKAGPCDAVIMALSGGASAMMVVPAEGITLADKVATTKLLMRSGATIHELNTVRKHLSAIKGGQLLRCLRAPRMIVLAVSDVADNDPATIGSGPAAADATTYAQARDVMVRYNVWELAPRAVRRHIERGVAGEIAETVKQDDPLLARVKFFILADNESAVSAAETAAATLGYRTVRWRELSGEARAVGREFASFLAQNANLETSGGASAKMKPTQASGKRCVLAGGEPVVTVRGDGLGGRAQELALACAIELNRVAPLANVALLCAGSDGIDGPTDAAGAFAGPRTVATALKHGADPAIYLERNDTYSLFALTGDLFKTGHTGVNAADLLLALIE
jgi:glycerate 2-kinase